MPPERKNWQIEVTDGDIEQAHQNDSYRCVVAKAIHRSIPDAKRIEVDIQTIRFSRNGERHVYLTPYAAAGYIVAFDAGDEIEPFSFLLRSPQTSPLARKTEAGRKLDNARNAVYRAKQKKQQADQVLAKPDAEPLDKSVAERDKRNAAASIAQANRELAELREKNREEGAKLSVRPGRRVPPTVYKSKQRLYGQRVLRVNQAEGRKHFTSQAQRYDDK